MGEPSESASDVGVGKWATDLFLVRRATGEIVGLVDRTYEMVITYTVKRSLAFEVKGMVAGIEEDEV